MASEEPDHDQQELEGVPEEAMRLATGELAIRIAEERRRREAGLATCTQGEWWCCDVENFFFYNSVPAWVCAACVLWVP